MTRHSRPKNRQDRPAKSRKSPLLATALILASASILTPTQAHADWPDWMDRWLYNAEERTRRGTASMEDKDYAQAAAAMDTAMRLAPEDATAKFNAGTSRLPLAPEEGRKLLESVDSETDPTLGSRAHYNAGNSLLEAGELESAISSFKESLRRDPSFEDAKFNLELAQKRLKEQQQQQENQDQQQQDQQNQDQQNEDQQNQDQQNQDQQDQENQDQQNQDQQEQENQDQQNQDEQNQEQQEQENQEQQSSESENPEEQEQEQQQPQNQNQDGQGDPGEEESPLPQFQDLPDMTAEEAAAILEAIENMEREQRRQEALEAAKANVGGKKDW